MNQEKIYLLIKRNNDDEDYPIGINEKTIGNFHFTDNITLTCYVCDTYDAFCRFNPILTQFDGYVYVVNTTRDAPINKYVSIKYRHYCDVHCSTKIIITQKYSLYDPATIDKLGLKIDFPYILIASAKGWVKILDLLKLPENKNKITKDQLAVAYMTSMSYGCNESIEWFNNFGLLNDHQ